MFKKYSMVSLTPEQRALAKRLEAEADEYALAHTVPIYALARGGGLKAHGSGVLLKIADAAFILSAAHVFDEDEDAVDPSVTHKVADENARGLLAGTGPGSPPVPLQGECQVTHDRHDIDFAFIRLTQEAEKAISAHKKFLRLDQVDLPRSQMHGVYCVVGFLGEYFEYPDEKGRFDSRPVSFTTALHDHNLVECTDGVSIVVSFAAEVFDMHGTPTRPPELGCISGCGIWRVIGVDTWQRGEWDPSMIRLAGIEHTVLGRKAIKGVLIHKVIAAIRKAHADLVPAIDLHRRPPPPR